MKQKLISLLLIYLILIVVLLCPLTSSGYLPKQTHPLINDKALRQASVDTFMKNQLGFSAGIETWFENKKAVDWIKQGGRDEDEDNWYRGIWHFHDPTKDWRVAGIFGKAFSSLDWAQDNTVSSPPPCDDLSALGISCPGSLTNSNPDRSWPGARKYFYNALTSTDPTTRNMDFKKTFKYLGHVMHLLADAAVPEHARNDAHMIFGSRYETWSEETGVASGLLSLFIDDNYMLNSADYSVITSKSAVNGYIPISNFWDTMPNQGYGGTLLGLAEYTNHNFLSPNTIFHNYTYPINPQDITGHLEVVHDIDEQAVERIYYSGITSDRRPIAHLVTSSYLWSDLESVSPGSMDSAKFILDENCFYDYASILVPKAVRYDAELLNYFFRGTVEITLPDDGIYAITDSNGSFNEIHLKARNTTANGEEMSGGTIQLVVKYRTAQTDPFEAPWPERSPEFTYTVAPESNGLTSLPTGTPTDLTFTLPTPIPLRATDVYLQVVYKGQLGTEVDAVAVGFKDISEPTPVDVVNNMDYVCINGSYQVAGSAAVPAVDFNNDGLPDLDVYPHGLVQSYLAFSPIESPREASSTTHAATSPDIPSGHYSRVFILSDYNLMVSTDATEEIEDSADNWGSYYDADISPITGVMNQSVFETVYEEVGGAQVAVQRYVYYSPEMTPLRGIKTWWPYVYDGLQYPDAVECTGSDTRSNLTGPVAVSVP